MISNCKSQFVDPFGPFELIRQIDPFFFNISCIRANARFAPVPAAEVCDETAQLTGLAPPPPPRRPREARLEVMLLIFHLACQDGLSRVGGGGWEGNRGRGPARVGTGPEIGPR